ncbi:YbaY family lipoprotein [Ferrovibrio sp.]|uniref:YbaY family lipoprotein n=1 Tax=Ferrovibrio sp. TaxID=1917215 RepID=UPI0025BBDFC6|nr:YbaY family lipoprotein [Ferrovibrio sp.]MBX3455158.1 YbaY family lipoprotein [Ferrovibrio sp.]
MQSQAITQMPSNSAGKLAGKRANRRHAVMAMLAIAALPLAACAGGPRESVNGSITYKDPIALPADSMLVVRLLDATRGNMAAYTVVEQRILSPRLPTTFDLRYRFGDINPQGAYYVQAQVEHAGRVLLINDRDYAVITRTLPSSGIQVNLVPTPGTVLLPATSNTVAPATTTTVIQTAPVPAQASSMPAPVTVIVPGGNTVITPAR